MRKPLIVACVVALAACSGSHDASKSEYMPQAVSRTSSTVPRMSANPFGASSANIVYDFVGGSGGANPKTPPMPYNGMLYGTASEGGYGAVGSGGVVYEFDPSNESERLVYAFCNYPNDACGISGRLTSFRNRLYGTSWSGGSSTACPNGTQPHGEQCGTVYEIDPATGSERVVFNFTGQQTGFEPQVGLTPYGGLLYGVAPNGGRTRCKAYGGNCGLVFAIDPSLGTERIVYRFRGGSDGWSPSTALALRNGKFYGTTTFGGTGKACPTFGYGPIGCGTIFELDPKTASERVVYSFKGGKDGYFPQWDLTLIGGSFYGVTMQGGGYGCGGSGCGTVFELQSNGTERIVHAFSGHADGFRPFGTIAELSGTIYGVTGMGGTGKCQNPGGYPGPGCGTVFAVSASGEFSSVYSFKGIPDGQWPEAITSFDNALYGVTLLGGNANGLDCPPSGGCGTIFKITP
jgi:hypothetical protein